MLSLIFGISHSRTMILPAISQSQLSCPVQIGTICKEISHVSFLNNGRHTFFSYFCWLFFEIFLALLTLSHFFYDIRGSKTILFIRNNLAVSTCKLEP